MKQLHKAIFYMRINDNCFFFLTCKPSQLECPKDNGSYDIHFTDGKVKGVINNLPAESGVLNNEDHVSAECVVAISFIYTVYS